MMPLYHYTCAHGRAAIGVRGQIICSRDTARSESLRRLALTPETRRVLDAIMSVSWFTDLETPNVLGLGLTSYSLTCDRTAYRYEVDAHSDATMMIEPWIGSTFRSEYRDLARELECYGSMPRHWWISYAPVSVLLSVSGDS